MIVFRTPRHVAMERQPQIGRGVVPADGLLVPMSNGHFLEHVGIAGGHAGVVHHLTQADDPFPFHRPGNFLRTDARAGRLEPRR